MDCVVKCFLNHRVLILGSAVPVQFLQLLPLLVRAKLFDLLSPCYCVHFCQKPRTYGLLSSNPLKLLV